MDGAEDTEEAEKEENEDSEVAEVLEEREDGRESTSDSERASWKERTWTGFAALEMDGRGASKTILNGMGEKVPLVGVGDTMEMSHFESIANISSASLSSCVDSSSCCASVGGCVRRLREERRAVSGLGCGVGSEKDRSSQTLAVLPSGMCKETHEGVM
jgi:hypothetical protein